MKLYIRTSYFQMEINKKKLVETLTKGRNSAKKLQNILLHKDNDDGLVCLDDLVNEISQSFYSGILLSNSCSSSEQLIIPEVHTVKTPAVKGRRGCYKRRFCRKTEDSRMEVSETIEDGYAWRKYGQKEIHNSNFPRCYYRCTHKQVHGCKALKQVQKLEDGSNMFHIIYFGHHTCPPPTTSSHHGEGLELDCENSNHHNPSTVTENCHIDPYDKEDDLSNKVSSAQSSSALVWKEILLDDFECFKIDGCLSDILSFDDFGFS